MILNFPPVRELIKPAEDLCACCGLPKIHRTTREIWADLLPLPMTGGTAEQVELRSKLITELNTGE